MNINKDKVKGGDKQTDIQAYSFNQQNTWPHFRLQVIHTKPIIDQKTVLKVYHFENNWNLDSIYLSLIIIFKKKLNYKREQKAYSLRHWLKGCEYAVFYLFLCLCRQTCLQTHISINILMLANIWGEWNCRYYCPI